MRQQTPQQQAAAAYAAQHGIAYNPNSPDHYGGAFTAGGNPNNVQMRPGGGGTGFQQPAAPTPPPNTTVPPATQNPPPQQTGPAVPPPTESTRGPAPYTPPGTAPTGPAVTSAPAPQGGGMATGVNAQTGQGFAPGAVNGGIATTPNQPTPAGQGGGGGGGAGGGNPDTSNQIANTLQPTYMPQTPQGIASTLSNAQLNALGPQASIQQILQGFEPQARQSQSALNNQLAAAGIVGGGAEDATDLLQGQLASSLAPTLASTIQNSQGMQLSGMQGNQNAMNSMTGTNLADIMGTNQFNATAANQAKGQLAGYQNQDWSQQLAAYQSLLTSFMGGGAGVAQGIGSNFPVFGNQGPLSWLLG